MYGPFLGLLLSMCFFNPTDGDSNLPVDDRVKTFFDAEVIYDEKREQTESTHVFKESVPRLLSRHDLEKISRMHHDHIHDVIFVIRPKNMDELTRVLHDISYPSSKNYGQHWTRDEVFNLTSNPEACDAIVTYLHSHGVSAVSESLNGEYITATAPIIVWEEIFNTEFFTFHQTHRNGRVEKLVRAEEYWIPKALESHIESVFNTIQMPYHLSGNLPNAQSISKLGTSHFHTSGLLYDGLITPLKIRHYYNMSTSVEGSSASTQAVYAPNAQYYSPVDLKFFQVNLAPPNRTVTTTTVATYSNDTICRIDLSSCATSNGALQYLMSTSSVSPTTYWYSDQSISDWLVTVSNSANPPLVLSISYVTYESYMSVSELNAFTIAAIKLSTMGVTIVVSSGDDGAVGEGVTYDGVGVCGYAPTFPASNPYVVSVGTTMGAERGVAEVVCEGFKNDSATTSGGGFSTFYDQPSYQKAHVDAYFVAAASAAHTPVAGYGKGRGYPDVSLAGYNYITRIGTKNLRSSGSVLSAPTVAGFFSSINAARLALGKGSLGWVNPALYANYTSYTNDVTKGNNRCVSPALCCAQGFYATAGWDPATGLGSLNYGKLSHVLVSNGVVNGAQYLPSTLPTAKPSSTPSAAPSTTKPSSARPSRIPTSKPTTRTPTSSPTLAIKTNILASQGMTGVTVAQASTPSFTDAIIGTVSQALGTSPKTVSGVIITTSGTAAAPDVGMIYAVNVTSGITTKVLLGRLDTSIVSGKFLKSLSEKSGVNISSVSGLVLLNTSPTISPTPSTVQGSSGYSVIFIAAVAGGGGLAVLILLLVCWVCCCCKRKRRMRRDQRNQAALVMPHLIVSHEIPNASSYNKDRYRDVPRRTPVAYPIRQSEDSSEEPHSFTESDEDVRFSSSTTITPY